MKKAFYTWPKTAVRWGCFASQSSLSGSEQGKESLFVFILDSLDVLSSMGVSFRHY